MLERLWRLLGSEENGGAGCIVNFSINHYDLRTFFYFLSKFPGSSNKPLGSLCSCKIACTVNGYRRKRKKAASQYISLSDHWYTNPI